MSDHIIGDLLGRELFILSEIVFLQAGKAENDLLQKILETHLDRKAYIADFKRCSLKFYAPNKDEYFFYFDKECLGKVKRCYETKIISDFPYCQFSIYFLPIKSYKNENSVFNSLVPSET